MTPRTRWFDVLIILLVIIASLYLAQVVWQVLGAFSDIILLFLLAWLLSFALDKPIDDLYGRPLPSLLTRFAAFGVGRRLSDRLAAYRFSRSAAVELVYAMFGLVLVTLIGGFVPVAFFQSSQLVTQIPELAKHVPEISSYVQDLLSSMGLRVPVDNAIQAALGPLQGLSTAILQNTIPFVSNLLGIIGNTIFVLIFSFFFALDGPRVTRTAFRLIPKEYKAQAQVFMESVYRTFGGFIRAQLIQAVIMAFGTALAMGFTRMDFVLVAAFFSGLFMVIPLIGPLLALVPPILVALLTQPGNAVLLIIILVIIEFILLNVITPRLLADALGLHPVIVFVSLLVGVKVAGLWGAIFGVPVAGVLVTMVSYLIKLWTEYGTLTPSDAPTTLPALAHTPSGQSSFPAEPRPASPSVASLSGDPLPSEPGS